MRYSSVAEGVGARAAGSAKAACFQSVPLIRLWWPENYHVLCIKCQMPWKVGDRGLWLSLNQCKDGGSHVYLRQKWLSNHRFGDQAIVIEGMGL